METYRVTGKLLIPWEITRVVVTTWKLTTGSRKQILIIAPEAHGGCLFCSCLHKSDAFYIISFMCMYMCWFCTGGINMLDFGQSYAYSRVIIWLQMPWIFGGIWRCNLAQNAGESERISEDFGTFRIIFACKVSCTCTRWWETIIECPNHVGFPPITATKHWWRQPIITRIDTIFKLPGGGSRFRNHL